jgi:hypothetical protein
MDFATFLAELVPCSSCAYPNESDAHVCTSCGHELEQEEVGLAVIRDLAPFALPGEPPWVTAEACAHAGEECYCSLCRENR